MSHILSVALVILLTSCVNNKPSGTAQTTPPKVQENQANSLKLGIDRTAEYLPLLAGKRVGLVVNHTTLFSNGTHLADSLQACRLCRCTVKTASLHPSKCGTLMS